MARMASFHVGVSAEAFAAGFFAQAGCDVLVQYGANQPDYDLVATRGDRMIRISVKVEAIMHFRGFSAALSAIDLPA